jgi:hypothetical protein
MNKLKHYLAIKTILSIVFVAALTASAFGQQSIDTKNVGATSTSNANAENTRTVDARQSGDWSVGIDPAKNTVQLSNTQSNPLSVKVVGSGSARKPFQARIIVIPLGTAFQTAFLPIPAGKRLVIENVSAITRCPEGLRMDINYFTYMDNDGDGIGGVEDITFHRFTLTDQGTFDGVSIFTANHKVLVFADEQIGAAHNMVGVSARLNGTATGHPQAQVTFSGYLEDLPTVQ